MNVREQGAVQAYSSTTWVTLCTNLFGHVFAVSRVHAQFWQWQRGLTFSDAGQASLDLVVQVERVSRRHLHALPVLALSQESPTCLALSLYVYTYY